MVILKLKGSSSQYGEDIIISELLNKQNGFYVDIGANDPYHFSNTNYFYKRGWNGINIEPNINLFNKLQIHRSRDINLNIGVGQKIENICFYIFSASCLSTFSEEAAQRAINKGFALTDKVEVQVYRLDSVLELYLDSRHIDFMSVDVEGYDLEVLKSNDWDRYRPTLVMVEVEHIANDEILNFMKEVGYMPVYNNKANIIFRDLMA